MIISKKVLQSLTVEQLEGLKERLEELSEAILIGDYSADEISNFGIDTNARPIQIVIALESLSSTISAELDERRRKAEEVFRIQKKLEELMSMEAQ